MRTSDMALRLRAMLCAIGFGLTVLVSAPHASAQSLLMDGTWVLSKRVLPDGTVLTPPVVHGRSTLKDGVNQLIVFWPTPSGSSASISMLSKWSASDSEVTATMILMVLDDGSGKPPVYDLSGRSRTVPVTRLEGGKVRYQHPLNGPVIERDGEHSKATVDGVFTDYWERLH